MQNITPQKGKEVKNLGEKSKDCPSSHSCPAPAKTNARPVEHVLTETQKPTFILVQENGVVKVKKIVKIVKVVKPQVPACIKACDVSSLLDQFLEYEQHQSATSSLAKGSSVYLTPASSPSHQAKPCLGLDNQINFNLPSGPTPPVSPPSKSPQQATSPCTVNSNKLPDTIISAKNIQGKTPKVSNTPIPECKKAINLSPSTKMCLNADKSLENPSLMASNPIKENMLSSQPKKIIQSKTFCNDEVDCTAKSTGKPASGEKYKKDQITSAMLKSNRSSIDLSAPKDKSPIKSAIEADSKKYTSNIQTTTPDKTKPPASKNNSALVCNDLKGDVPEPMETDETIEHEKPQEKLSSSLDEKKENRQSKITHNEKLTRETTPTVDKHIKTQKTYKIPKVYRKRCTRLEEEDERDDKYRDFKRKKYMRDECYESSSDEENDYSKRHLSQCSKSDKCYSRDEYSSHKRHNRRSSRSLSPSKKYDSDQEKMKKRRDMSPLKEDSEETNVHLYDIENERKKNFKLDRASKQTSKEKRKIVYIGNIDDSMSKNDIWAKFRKYGPIEKTTVHYRTDGDSYSFVTFIDSSSALEAIEESKRDPDLKDFDVCFGGRRKYCGGSYVDFDSTTSSFEEQQEKEGTRRASHTNGEVDFDTLLKMALKNKKR